MAQFNGKWKLVQSRNVVKFFKDIGMMTDDMLKEGPDYDDVSNNFFDVITVTGNKMKVTELFGDEKMDEYEHPLTGEYQETRHGMSSRIKTKQDGNKITLEDHGKDYVAVYVRVVEGDKMTVNITSEKVSCTAERVFQKQ